MRSLVRGAGAIGGTLAAHLARAGGDITMVDTLDAFGASSSHSVTP
jgi:glycine/D-amino acid oxidase-like deaminating enzyme